jgi:hypothetical protein
MKENAIGAFYLFLVGLLAVLYVIGIFIVILVVGQAIGGQ